MKPKKPKTKMSETATEELTQEAPAEATPPAKKGRKPKAEGGEKTKAQVNAEMAKNAEIIQAAKAGGATIEPVIEMSEKPLNEILNEYVTYSEGHTSCTIKEGMPLAEWTSALAGMIHMQEHMGFLIGDMIRYGEGHFGDKYAIAVKVLGREYKTLVNWAITSKEVPPEHRRKELSYSHHAEVAKLPAAKQKRLLTRAVEEKMSVAKLREEVKKLDAPAVKPASPAAAAASGPNTPIAEYETLRNEDESGAKPATEGEMLGLQGETSKPAPQTTTTTEGLSAEDRVKNDEQIERADALQTYIRSDLWAKLGVADKKQWLSILKPLCDAYEKLIDEVG